MKKVLYVNGEESGEIGKPVFKDSLGRQLCVGDIVYTINGKIVGISTYKIINYTQIENLDEKILKELGARIIIKNCNKKEMTIAEIEKELGYSIKIVKE